MFDKMSKLRSQNTEKKRSRYMSEYMRNYRHWETAIDELETERIIATDISDGSEHSDYDFEQEILLQCEDGNNDDNTFNMDYADSASTASNEREESVDSSQLAIDEQFVEHDSNGHTLPNDDDRFDNDHSDGTESSSDTETNETAKPVCMFLDEIAAWSISHDVTREGTNELLSILRHSGYFYKSDIPKDARTLKKTPRDVNVIDKCGGNYTYFGIEMGLLEMSSKFVISNFQNNCIALDFNIDGIPIQDSSNYEFWPILCSVYNLQACPFIVALYGGPKKPSDVEGFLSDFVSELCHLITNGIVINNMNYSVALRTFICDAPARAFLKSITYHTAKNACERCTVVGVRTENRTVFTNDIADKRSDPDFRANKYKEHKFSDSPILRIPGVDVINSIVLDSMHLVYLGVCRRLLTFLKSGPNVKLSNRQLKVVSDRLLSISSSTPSEFVRRPRSMFDLERWKATELRQFTLYTGIIVLHGVVNNDMYNLFLALSIAMRILHIKDVSERSSLLPGARALLAAFVHNSRIICGDCFATYNVHNLLHICDDVEFHKCAIDEMSAFPYENYLQHLKKTVRNATRNPVVSAVKRLHEQSNSCQLGYKIRRNASKISPKRRDKYFICKGGQYCEVLEVISDGKNNVAYACRVISATYLRAAFTSPMDSSQFGIMESSLRDKKKWRPQVINKSDVHQKLYAIENAAGSLVFFPLIHNIECKITA